MTGFSNAAAKRRPRTLKGFLLPLVLPLVLSLVLPLAAAAILAVSPFCIVKAEAETVRGIDVSSWQGDINWGAVADSGVKFAMIRLGNIEYGLDSNFAQNIVGAGAVGIRAGVYVYTYAENVQEAITEAAFAVAAMSQFPVSFPVAIDFEDKSLRSLTPEQQAEIVNAFCTVIYNAGYTPMVYSNKNWFMTRMGYVPWDHWVAEYADSCTYPGAYTIWQASDKGKVPGIAGNVDIDYLFHDYFSEIIPNGLLTRGGDTYLFRNYLRQVGMQQENGVTYFFGADGRMVRDLTTADAEGNIIRMCKDGHVVVITAAAQAAAAQAQLIAQQAELTFQQAKSTELLYEQTAAAWNEQYAAALSQAQLLEQAAAAAAEAALVLPTPENQAAAAVTLEQAQTALQAAAQIESEMTAATQGWITAQQAAAAARADADNALAAAQAAQLMIQIPE